MLEWVAICFFQGTFPTQGLNLGLLHCRQIFYHWATKKALYISYGLVHLLLGIHPTIIYTSSYQTNIQEYWEYVPFLIAPKIKQLHVHQNKMAKLEHNTAMKINQILLHTLTQTNLINIYWTKEARYWVSQNVHTDFSKRCYFLKSPNGLFHQTNTKGNILYINKLYVKFII